MIKPILRACLPALLAGLLFSPTLRAETAPDCPAPLGPLPDWTAAQTADLVKSAKDKGFLWRISKGGHDSYLYGTLHMGKVEWMVPGPLLVLAMKASNKLALEVDPTKPDAAAYMADPASWGVRYDQLSAGTQQQLRQMLRQGCLPDTLTQQMSAAMLVTSLSMLDYLREGLDFRLSSEVVLAGLARGRKMPVVELESAKAQLDLFESLSLAEVETYAQAAAELQQSGQGRVVARRLIDAWREGRLDEMSRFEEWCDCVKTDADRDFMFKLNDARNGPMADKVARMHEAGDKLLVAVGGLHMTGEQGLPTLLAKRGFKVKQLVPEPAH
ncbi:TraB/GumN family protein [Chitinolyticbacter meiyuanensis]|uniref:TraB/GumN family protein n=1 Tax=Chitinolyticbacter meiyuanensis TaxID=682798 RepID=UPI0016529F2A|nr:TraB/GumN family protein [Chitinolyticbacter meiyuanensis]